MADLEGAPQFSKIEDAECQRGVDLQLPYGLTTSFTYFGFSLAQLTEQ
jgi:hypothetical protein